MIPQQLFQKEDAARLGKEISPALWFKLFVFLSYTAKNTFRSIRFVWAYLFVCMFFYLFYSLNLMVFSILPSYVSGIFLICIIISDGFIKYYMPGQFVEYILSLIRISLCGSLVSVYILFNTLFFYTNIAVLSSLLLGVKIESVVYLLTSFILNHIVVLLFKIKPIYKEGRKATFFVLAMVILNMAGILLMPNIIASIFILGIVLVFTERFLKFYFFAKI